MMDLLRSAVTGQHPLSTWEDLEKAEYVAALSFGHRIEAGRSVPGPINQELARRAVGLSGMLDDIPVIAQQEITDAIEAESSFKVARTIDAHREAGKYLDTSEYLEQAAGYVDELGLAANGIVVAHAFHVSRVVAQASKVGLDLVLAGSLPKGFDPESEQWWTRRRSLWITREVPAILAFKLKGKI